MSSNLKTSSTDLDNVFITEAEFYTNYLLPSDELWAWGYNGLGTLGQNDTTNRSSPVQVGTLTNWAAVDSGGTAVAAIKTGGTLWTWGANLYGALGQGDTTSRSSPVQVGTLTNWSSVSVGGDKSGNNTVWDYIAAIKTDGTLWAWGYNADGRLGLGDTTSRSSPVQVGSLTNWSKVSCGSAHVGAIKTDGTLWMWGIMEVASLDRAIRQAGPVRYR